MIDFPVNNIQTVQVNVVNESKMIQSSKGAFHQMSEVDLSFCDALASQCSSDTSSGPVDRRVPTAKKT
jgi:hypothetical protein